MAYILLYCHVFLELLGGWYLRFCDQSSDCPLLYPRAKHHAALFGVYGILGIGLILFVLRGLYPERHWNDRLIGWAFWLINIGLLVMICVSILPIGIMQAVESIRHGYWSARSVEFMQTDLMQTIRWLRVPGDLLLAFGELLLVYFIIGLKTGWSLKEER